MSFDKRSTERKKTDMSIFGRKKEPAARKAPAAPRTLMEDIPAAADWVAKALNSSGYRADYTLESMKELDRFFDEQNGPGGILEGRRGQVLFAAGSYVGQTAIRLYGGGWITDDGDPEGEIKIAVRLTDGTVIWPVIRCMKRCKDGPEESLYAYLYALGRG